MSNDGGNDEFAPRTFSLSPCLQLMIVPVLFGFILCRVAMSDGVTWGILLAGANKWENYWSQADICQVFQIMKSAGVSEDHLITWMYDDIADNWHNVLHKGEIFNCRKCPDVYKGVAKDLTGKDITPENWMKLLRGETMTIGSGKSLKSTKEDRIFIYYSDHGGAGVAFFPGFVPLHAADLIATLKFMHEHEMYSEMVIYMDTCHSGSMFNQLLPPEWNIYAATSADPNNVAWLCDCDQFPIGEHCVNNCWGRLFMVDTMDSLKAKTFSTRTIEEQFLTVQNQTWAEKTQQACQYGNFGVAYNNSLSRFQGPGKSHQSESDVSVGKQSPLSPATSSSSFRIKKTEAKYHYLKARAESEENLSHEDRAARRLELAKYEEHMKRIDVIWSGFGDALGLKLPNQHVDCYPKNPIRPGCMKEMIETATSVCGMFDEYSSQYLVSLKVACDERVGVESVREALESRCP